MASRPVRNRRGNSDRAEEYEWSEWEWDPKKGKYYRWRYNSKGRVVWDSHFSFASTAATADQQHFDNPGYPYNDQAQDYNAVEDVTQAFSSPTLTEQDGAPAQVDYPYEDNIDTQQRSRYATTGYQATQAIGIVDSCGSPTMTSHEQASMYSSSGRMQGYAGTTDGSFVTAPMSYDSPTSSSNYYDDQSAQYDGEDPGDNSPYLSQSYGSGVTVTQATHHALRRSRSDPPAQTPPAPLRLPSTISISLNDVHKKIKGTKGEHEKLDPEFKVHSSRFFQPGQIFKVVWAEPAGENSRSDATSMTDVTSEGWTIQDDYGTKVYSTVRRFVVVATKTVHSDCVPILTYGRQGLNKPSLHAEDHAIIYTTDQPPLNSDSHVNTPIKMERKSPRDKLEPTSLINYAKIYRVEHNIKVQFIGWIAKASQAFFAEDFDYIWNNTKQLRGNTFDKREKDSKQESLSGSTKLVSNLGPDDNLANIDGASNPQNIHESDAAAIPVLNKNSSDDSSSVKNPIFSDDILPSTMSKSSVVKPEEQNDTISNDETSKDIQDGLDLDIRSMISDDNDINSSTSTRKTQQQITAEEHFARLFAERLRPICEEALTKLGRDRFVDNFRRLLKRFYLDLMPHATINLQKATLHLLQSRWTRIRIAKKIVDILRPEPEDITVQNGISLLHDKCSMELDQKLDAERKLRDLEKWIVASAGLNVGAPPETSDVDQSAEHTSMGDAEEDGDDEDSDEGYDEKLINGLSNISKMEDFVINGNPFLSLHVNLRLFLLPASLAPMTRIIMSIPKNRIRFDRADDLSFSNKSKLYIEEHTGNWNWWPLQQSIRKLKEGETRVYWQCHCGRSLWAEIATSHALSYQALLEHRGTHLHHSHLCKRKDIKCTRKPSIANFVQAAATIALQACNPFGSSEDSISTATAAVSSSGQSSSPTNMSTGSSQPSSVPSQQDVQISLGDSLNNQLFVLFGVQTAGPTLELAQLDTKQYTDDGAFFRDLREKYKKMRGRWRYLFSVWRLRYCDFVKFEKIRANRIIHRGKDVPTDPNYEYTPRPPNAEIPPISPHEFELAFTSCSSECPLSKLHNCVESPDGNFAIERIPKRKGALEIQVGSAEFAWGIQAQYSISFLGLVMYHILILGGTFGFWGWWVHYHPGDLQNASVPLSTAMVLLSLFWSSAGVLKILREPV